MADEVLRPFREAAERLATMPGVSETVARVIIAEVGVDMTQFPSAGHLVSWAGLCPSLDESAGKRRSTRIRHATPWLKTALVQAAWAATRKNGSYLQAQFRRLKGRRGPKKAIVAVAASMLTAAYFMLRDETDYHDLGGRYLANRDKQRVTQSLLRASAEPWRRGRSEGRLNREGALSFFLVLHPAAPDPRIHETGYRVRAWRWHRGRSLYGAKSPFSSWTRSPASTPYCEAGIFR